ncbi:MAG: hypothetical protein ACMXYF_00990 [Candidatus Woesearchaeota archaeon]
MRHEAKTLMIGRKPRQKPEHDFKTAFFKLFNGTHPLRGGDFPTKELEFPNIERVEFDSAVVQYYLEGNDLVFRNLKAIEITQEGPVLHVSFEKD